VWGARDPGSGIIYLYSEHYQGKASRPRTRRRFEGGERGWWG